MTLARRVSGSGPPLLLINGYAATGVDWDPGFLAALGEYFEVICPDNRGVGESERGAGELTIEAMAADIEDLLASLEIERCAVAGWSMGGFVAQGLARRVPARVASLALLATDPGGPDSIPAAPAAWSRLTDRSGSEREQATRLISLLFPSPLAAQIDAELGTVVAAARAALDPEALGAQEAAMEAWHRQGVAPGSGVPPADRDPPRRPRRGDPGRQRGAPGRCLARRSSRGLSRVRPRPDGAGAGTRGGRDPGRGVCLSDFRATETHAFVAG